MSSMCIVFVIWKGNMDSEEKDAMTSFFHFSQTLRTTGSVDGESEINRNDLTCNSNK